MTRRKTIPALVVGETVTALGTLRGLARVGIEAFTVTSPAQTVRHSRWYKPIPGHEGLLPEEIDRWLPDIPVGRAVVLPCSDNTVWQCSLMAEAVKSRIAMAVPTAAAIETLIDKARFATVLDRLQIPHPRTWLLDDGYVPDSVPDAAFESAFLKPADSQSFIGQYGIKAEKVSSRQKSAARLAEYNRNGFSMVLQEYVPGPAHCHFFVDGFVNRHHEAKAIFARRRLRMNPPDFGNSSCMVSLPLCEVQGAVDSTRKLLRDIDYRGIFSAEFKLDERDGEYKVLEVNARPWWFVEFPARCGINVCEMAYLDALGEEVEEVCEYRLGASMVYTRHDYFACRDSMKRKEMSIVAWAYAWLRAWRPIFAWDDPWPAFVGTFRFLSRRLGRTVKRLNERMHPLA